MTNVDLPISLNDLQLARSALTDVRAEEKLFCRIYPRILKIAWLVLGDGRQADDAAQTAVLQVFNNLDSFRGTGTIESWAEKIAYRTATKTFKRQKMRDKLFFSLAQKDGVHHETPEMMASKREVFEMLINKVKYIPEKRRVPLLLHLAYGYTVREISSLAETSQNTIKARLKTGYRELRSILNQNPDLLAAMEDETP